MTTPLEIKVALDTPLYTQRITLDGIEYLFRFDWSDREQRWYLTISDIDEKELASGIKIIANWPLLRRFVNPALPRGTLMAADLSPQNGEPPTYAELGQRVKLVYFSIS